MLHSYDMFFSRTFFLDKQTKSPLGPDTKKRGPEHYVQGRVYETGSFAQPCQASGRSHLQSNSPPARTTIHITMGFYKVLKREHLDLQRCEHPVSS